MKKNPDSVYEVLICSFDAVCENGHVSKWWEVILIENHDCVPDKDEVFYSLEAAIEYAWKLAEKWL